jgi:hypothetical protein
MVFCPRPPPYLLKGTKGVALRAIDFKLCKWNAGLWVRKLFTYYVQIIGYCVLKP